MNLRNDAFDALGYYCDRHRPEDQGPPKFGLRQRPRLRLRLRKFPKWWLGIGGYLRNI